MTESKTVRISDDFHESLWQQKKRDESFEDLIKRKFEESERAP